MSQIFHRSTNIWSKVSIIAGLAFAGFLGWVVVTHVVCVTELNRLHDVLVGPRDVAGPSEDHQERDEAANEEEKPCEAGLGEEIGAAIEDLRHREFVRLAARRRGVSQRARVRPGVSGSVPPKLVRPTGICTTVVKKGSSVEPAVSGLSARYNLKTASHP